MPMATGKAPFLSVIVAFRNEAFKLPDLVNCLIAQTYPTHLFEVILIDDNSTDDTVHRIKSITNLPHNFRVIASQGRGKKQAIKSGIAVAIGEAIVTTDADCHVGNNWLAAISEQLQRTGASMLIGPVTMQSDGTLFSDIQQLDFFALQISGAAATIIKRPVFCSGANLIYCRSIYQENHNLMHGNHLASGDDVFLLHLFKQKRHRISFIRDERAIVTTATEPTFIKFIKQRMRWGGKSKAYHDADSIILAITVLSANLAIVITMIGAILWPKLWLVAISGWVLKTLADITLLRSGKKFFGTTYKPKSFIIYASIYPFILCFTALVGLIFTANWKHK